MSMLLRIAERALNRPLLVHPDKIPLVLGVLEGRFPIGDVSDWRRAAEARIDALPDAARTVLRGPAPEASRFVGSAYDNDPATGETKALPYKRTADGIAVITTTGTLISRGAWIGSYSGETSYEGIKHQFQMAAADPKVAAIVHDIESPGGEAVGAFEAADAIRAVAAVKPVTAVVNGMAASAAYALASGASRIVVTPTGLTGSIGVVMVHADWSRKLDKDGITPTLIFAGAHKVDGNPFEPLPDSVHADLQREVDRYYDLFVETVAAGRRGLSARAIRATEARIYIGAEAVDAGLADAVGSFESVLSDFSRGRAGRTTSSTRRISMTERNDGVPGAENPDEKTPAAAVETPKPEADKPAAAPPAPAAPTAEDVKTRIAAILDLEEAKGREALARKLALETDMTAAQAKAMLAAAPVGGAGVRSVAERMAAHEGALADAGAADRPTTAAAWDKVVAKVNSRVSARS